MYNCLECGHAKWKHYKMFAECIVKGCDCIHYKVKSFKPWRRNEGKG